jgi:hypothetical protein
MSDEKGRMSFHPTTKKYTVRTLVNLACCSYQTNAYITAILVIPTTFI